MGALYLPRGALAHEHTIADSKGECRPEVRRGISSLACKGFQFLILLCIDACKTQCLNSLFSPSHAPSPMYPELTHYTIHPLYFQSATSTKTSSQLLSIISHAIFISSFDTVRGGMNLIVS